jgi:site-specific DNA-methyltransferase (adenine-specific)
MRAICIEINPDYVAMTKDRLNAKFTGFDSVDPRMERVPMDLRRSDISAEYLENHKKWFLSHHENTLNKFEESVSLLYGEPNRKLLQQITLFELFEKKCK